MIAKARQQEGGEDENDDVAGHMAHEEGSQKGAGIVEEGGGEGFEAVARFFHAGAVVAGKGEEYGFHTGKNAGDCEEDQQEEEEEEVGQEKSHGGIV